MTEKKENQNLIAKPPHLSIGGGGKPPVVVVMGHVDHGKTTLIDYIRKTKVAEKETGGITQHIGAYEIRHTPTQINADQKNSGGSAQINQQESAAKQITFIDTPGHEAFSQIRSRGAKAADIAILVVSADDGVQPQTKEALEHIKLAKIPFIVAINKIDKPNTQPERVKKQLSDLGILLEEWGGDVQVVAISAKTGEGVKDLLDLIILIAEINELKADVGKNAGGVVLESRMDSKKGLVITALVNEGILKTGDYLAIAGSFWKIKFMENFLGRPINNAWPSTPVLIGGFSAKSGSASGGDGKIEVGDLWIAFDNKEEAEKAVVFLKSSKPAPKSAVNQYNEKKVLDIILKADVFGSLEAIESVIRGFNFKEAAVRVVKSGLGNISEEDLKIAKSGNAKICGFKVRFLPQVENIARMMNVESIFFDVIYELVDFLKEEMTKLLEPEVKRIDLGELKALAIFGKSKEGMIIGGQIREGSVRKSSKAEIIRGGKTVGKGKVIELKHNKDEREEIREGSECGINLASDSKVEIGDILKFYNEEIKAKKLE